MPGDEVIQTLEKHPLSRAPQKLIALDLRAHNDPSQCEAILQQALDSLGKGDSESLVALARWLNNKQEHQRELDAIPLRRAVQNRELFLQRLDALGALGQWSEIKRLLVSEAFPLDPSVEAMYLARCNQQLGEFTASQNNWQRAFEAAGGDPQKLLTLADYAEKNGATPTAEKAYNTVVREAPHVRLAQQGRLRVAQSSRDTRKIHAVLIYMLKQWPNDSAIQNDEAYTRLLLASAQENKERRFETAEGASQAPSESGGTTAVSSTKEPITVAQLAEQLVQREPASLPHRTLLALARLQSGDAAKALEVYNGIHVAPNAASPSAIAIHAAVLAANGQMESARAEASAVKDEQLLPEEQEMIAKLR